MLGIVLLILKIIGILLLCIIALILFIVALLLFVPFRYNLMGSRFDDIKGSGQITYLLGILKITAEYNDSGFHYDIRVLGRSLIYKKEKPVKKDKDKKGKRDKENKPDADRTDKEKQPTDEIKAKENEHSESEAKADNAKQSADETKADNVEQPMVRTKAAKAKPPTDKTKSLDSKKEKTPLGEKISAIFHKVVATISGIYGKIKKLKDIVFSDEVRILRDSLFFIVTKLGRHMRPRSAKGNVTFGFEDPSTTGYVTAIVSVIYPRLPEQLILHSEFQAEKTILEGEISVRGRVFGFYVTYLALKTLFDKKTIPAFRRLRQRLS